MSEKQRMQSGLLASFEKSNELVADEGEPDQDAARLRLTTHLDHGLLRHEQATADLLALPFTRQREQPKDSHPLLDGLSQQVVQ
jgi:hypothetical protein